MGGRGATSRKVTPNNFPEGNFRENVLEPRSATSTGKFQHLPSNPLEMKLSLWGMGMGPPPALSLQRPQEVAVGARHEPGRRDTPYRHTVIRPRSPTGDNFGELDFLRILLRLLYLNFYSALCHMYKIHFLILWH